MKRSTFALVLSLAAVFLSGAVVGGFGFRIYSGSPAKATSSHPKPEEFRRWYVDTVKERVHLTPQQVDQLHSIMDLARQRFKALDAKAKPEKKAIFNEQNEAIMAMLDKQQQVEFTKLREEWAEKRNKRNSKRPKDH